MPIFGQEFLTKIRHKNSLFADIICLKLADKQ